MEIGVSEGPKGVEFCESMPFQEVSYDVRWFFS